MAKLLILGASGQLGQCFQAVSNDFPQHILYFTTAAEVNINRPEHLESYYKKNPFEIVINCAAYTQVDQAEKEEVMAFAVNKEGLTNVIRYAQKKQCALIHFSTDFVFDGTATKPYLETDIPQPINVYGRSKWEGEKQLRNANILHTTFRVSWLFSPYGKNFVKTILHHAAQKKELKVVNDQFGKPTYGIDLARTILSTIDHPNFFKNNLYHYAQGPLTSWFGFAKKIVEMGSTPCRILPISSKEYPTLAIRPAYSVLDTQHIEKTLSLSLPGWEKALSDCLKRINE